MVLPPRPGGVMSDDKRPCPSAAAAANGAAASASPGNDGDGKRPWPSAAPVLTALAALAIVIGAWLWVLAGRVPIDTDLRPRLEALPGDRQATLKLEPGPPDAPDVKWQYEQRYAEREGELTDPPVRWKSLPKEPKDHVVTGLTNGWGYVFRVRAVRGGKQGPPSNEATVTPTAVPARLDEIAELTRALGQDVVTPEQWQAATSRLAAAIGQGFENLTRVTDGRGAALQQILANLSLPATDQQLAAIEKRLAGIEMALNADTPPTVTDEQSAEGDNTSRAPTANSSPPVTDEQWTELMERLTAIATYLETISRRMPPRADETERNPESRSSDDSDDPPPGGETEQDRGTTPVEISRELTRFHFPNARLADGVPAGDGVAIPEQDVNRTLAALGACAREGAPVTVKPYGFASDAVFRNADGTQMARSDALNLKTANLRARNAYRELTARADAYPHVRVEAQHEWSSLDEMKQKRDDGSLIPHSDDEQERERMRRVVVLEVLAPGGCAELQAPSETDRSARRTASEDRRRDGGDLRFGNRREGRPGT